MSKDNDRDKKNLIKNNQVQGVAHREYRADAQFKLRKRAKREFKKKRKKNERTMEEAQEKRISCLRPLRLRLFVRLGPNKRQREKAKKGFHFGRAKSPSMSAADSRAWPSNSFHFSSQEERKCGSLSNAPDNPPSLTLSLFQNMYFFRASFSLF